MQLLDRIRSSISNPFNKPVLTLSIEGSNVRLMTAEAGRISEWLELPFHPRAVNDGQIADPARLGQVIKIGVARLGLTLTDVVAAFPSSRISFHMMSLPTTAGIRPDRAIPREARRIMGSALDYHYPFWNSLGREGLEERYYLLAAPKGELAAFFQAEEADAEVVPKN